MQEQEKKEAKKTSILLQVSVLFVIAIAITALATYMGQEKTANVTVTNQVEELAQSTADEVILALKEYPSYEWLLKYWYEHAYELNIEYDSDFRNGSATRTKSVLWNERHPRYPLRYVKGLELENLPESEKKLFAEIMYTWLITRINQIKETYNASFLFCALTDETCQSQFFLFSAADKDSVRGTSYGEAFILGTIRNAALSQQEAMRDARENEKHLADAGDYVDYYVHMSKLGNKDVFIGLTFAKKDLYKRISSQTRSESLNSIFYQVILLIIALFMLLLYVIRPLRYVRKNIRLYKQTKDSKTVSENLRYVNSHNEIEELAEDVSDLTREIEDHVARIESITAEKERISTELALAETIQKSRLPSVFPAFPDRHEFDIYATMTPAKEVGGDFYDFRMLDDDHLYIAIADVSGKGVPAALYMMSTMIILANNAKQGKSPSEILVSTNNSVCEKNPEEMFITAWIGILEISTGRLMAANAGHEYPAIMYSGAPFIEERNVHGMVLGALEGMKYPEYEIRLTPGSKIFLYTDGIIEATNASKKLFGVSRMLQALNNTEKTDTPEQILAAVRKAVDGFVKEAPQFDDMTMMCIEYFGSEKEDA